MNPHDFLEVMLYILSSILLVVLIILGIKMIITMNKIENVVDNITVKVNKLNGLFNVIDATTDKLSMVSDKMVDSISSLVSKIFERKKRKEDDNYE